MQTGAATEYGWGVVSEGTARAAVQYTFPQKRRAGRQEVERGTKPVVLVIKRGGVD